MTNEEAKRLAINKAWSRHDHNGYDVNGFSSNYGAKYDIWNGDFDLIDGLHRPIELRGINENNGWTRIEPDGSNLPKDSNKYYVITKGGFLNEAYFELEASKFYDFGNEVTHYKPIKEEPKPIY